MKAKMSAAAANAEEPKTATKPAEVGRGKGEFPSRFQKEQDPADTLIVDF